MTRLVPPRLKRFRRGHPDRGRNAAAWL